MADVASRLTEQEMADLCALADGTLPDARRAAVEEWVASSPELQVAARAPAPLGGGDASDRERGAVRLARRVRREPRRAMRAAAGSGR